MLSRSPAVVAVILENLNSILLLRDETLSLLQLCTDLCACLLAFLPCNAAILLAWYVFS